MTVGNTLRTTAARCIGALFFLHVLAALAAAQAGPPTATPPNPFKPVTDDPFSELNLTSDKIRSFENNGGVVVLVSVFAEDGKTRLDRQSVVKTTNQAAHTVNWQATDEKSQAALELPVGKYQFEVSAVGYLSEQKELQVAGSIKTIPLEIILRRDPTAVDLNITDAALSPKARKQAKNAVSALQSGNLTIAKRKLDAAYQLAPSNPDLNYLLGCLFYQQKDFGRARIYLGTASDLDPHYVRALTLLGRVEFIQQDYPLATATLERAVAADSDYWMAHDLLAGAYLNQRKYEQARQQAELAIAKAKNGASTAHLALGQALVYLGKRDEGVRVLKAFVQDSPQNPAVPQVRELIAALEAINTGTVPATKNDTGNGVEAVPKNAMPVPGVDPLLASPELPISVKPWQPPGIDEVKPTVALGVSCPYDTVIEMSGKRVKELVDDVSRIAAIEHLVHERVDEMGNPATRETRDYNYEASISEEMPGYIGVDEYRSERQLRADYVDGIATKGFAALALVFHPVMRENFEMSCEGLGRWHEQAAWLVHFKQRADRPARFQDYKVDGVAFSMQLKGRAWIAADKFQIVRIEAELVSPVSTIQLGSERQVVEYSPVLFQQKNVELWLPKTVEIYLDFRKRRYFRTHSFDHYMLFSVDSQEKRKEPKMSPTEITQQPLPN
jgi:tetratricopeptide (TPR) repeat protein